VAAKDIPVDENGRPTYKVQFHIYDDDVAEFFALFGEGETAAPVARRLFLYGLSWCGRACGEFADPQQKKRRQRLGLDSI
jgi:hypothetical protein